MKRNKGKNSNAVLYGLLKFGLFILTVLIIALVMSKYLVKRVTVHNHSMEHTLESGDSVLIDKISYRFSDPKRFDIIVFRQKGSEDLIKRVIGLPDETVQIKDGRIYINDEEIDDIEGLDPPEYAGIAETPVQLSKGEYFVIGDNRAESIDSRYEDVGIVPSTKITGRMLMRLPRVIF